VRESRAEICRNGSFAVWNIDLFLHRVDLANSPTDAISISIIISRPALPYRVAARLDYSVRSARRKFWRNSTSRMIHMREKDLRNVRVITVYRTNISAVTTLIFRTSRRLPYPLPRTVEFLDNSWTIQRVKFNLGARGRDRVTARIKHKGA